MLAVNSVNHILGWVYGKLRIETDTHYHFDSGATLDEFKVIDYTNVQALETYNKQGKVETYKYSVKAY
jgi:hypothetical protein